MTLLELMMVHERPSLPRGSTPSRNGPMPGMLRGAAKALATRPSDWWLGSPNPLAVSSLGLLRRHFGDGPEPVEGARVADEWQELGEYVDQQLSVVAHVDVR